MLTAWIRLSTSEAKVAKASATSAPQHGEQPGRPQVVRVGLASGRTAAPVEVDHRGRAQRGQLAGARGHGGAQDHRQQQADQPLRQLLQDEGEEDVVGVLGLGAGARALATRARACWRTAAEAAARCLHDGPGRGQPRRRRPRRRAASQLAAPPAACASKARRGPPPGGASPARGRSPSSRLHSASLKNSGGRSNWWKTNTITPVSRMRNCIGTLNRPLNSSPSRLSVIERPDR